MRRAVSLYGLILDNEKRGVNKSLPQYINERQKEMETYPFCRRNDLLVYYFKIFHIILYRAREMYMIITTMCRYVPMLLEEISMTACGLWIDNRYSIKF